MPGDNRSQRFVKTWWAVAFIAGTIAGAAGTIFVGVPYTVWGIAGFGLPVVGLIAILEWLRVRRLAPRSGGRRWGYQVRTNPAQSQYKDSKSKLQSRRGQLRAIAGRKSGEPPSSSHS